MPYWLSDTRSHQHSDIIQRFDPRFWTVNFPRPMMASVVTIAADALRVDAVFYHKDALAGLIWESEDRLDHPLLAYKTDRDYRRTALSFRWRSSGVLPLDAVHGPTLTIEGRDSAGNPRSWFVRLWNYAQGTPQDAVITLPFSDLDGGFLLPAEADPVFAGDIDRMFISLVPPDYEPAGGVLTTPAEGWAEISDIRCQGERAMLNIGDVQIPPHGASMATAYDDSFNLTPERMLRNLTQLGYEGPVNHYVGMSHYFQLTPQGEDHYVSIGASSLNTPCVSWHQDLAERLAAMDRELILSLSYELFNAHCWNDWKQRTESGEPALTGWVPPSTLLSPANPAAMNYLQLVARDFVAIQQASDLPVRFQIGEPWWWITFGGEICLYDDAARAALGADLVSIGPVTGPKTPAQQNMLDRAGEILAASTADLAQAVRDAAGPQGAELSILIYLPTIADAASPDMVRANVPLGWARPAFDVLQLEDYDWVTDGNAGARTRALSLVQERLQYPLAEQHYFSGFVLNPEDKAQWRHIHTALNAAADRGVATRFIWALPQVMRDGFTFFQIAAETSMREFDEVYFPLPLSQQVSVAAEFSTQTVESLGGAERRNARWSNARLRFDAGPAVRSEQDLALLLNFYRARFGPARGFLLTDPLDNSSASNDMVIDGDNQLLGVGDGAQTDYPLIKTYGDEDPQIRRITRPDPASVLVSLDGVVTQDFTLLPMGIIRLDSAPAAGVAVRAGFRFAVPVRFVDDQLEVNSATFAAGETPSVPLLEIREAAQDEAV